MSNLTLLLDSSKTTQHSDDFEIYLNRQIELRNYPHEVAMKSLYTWFTWFNIHDMDYNNHQFRYYNGTVWKTVVIPNGNYNAQQLEEAIHAEMKNNTDVTTDAITGQDTFHINLTPNYSTIKMLLQLTNGYKVDFSLGNLYKIYGFGASIFDTTQHGLLNANITNSVNTMNIHCSLCNGGSYDNNSLSDILFSFVPSVPPGGAISLSPFQPTYLPIDRLDRIDRVRIRLTDQLSRRISLNGEALTIELHIRPRVLVDGGSANNKY